MSLIQRLIGARNALESNPPPEPVLAIHLTASEMGEIIRALTLAAEAQEQDTSQ